VRRSYSKVLANKTPRSEISSRIAGEKTMAKEFSLVFTNQDVIDFVPKFSKSLDPEAMTEKKMRVS